ncbi:hypothetical protein SAMD00019534_080450 [Acytostelium subglobosum LB1]|uniref:hypothetical protein n=1 Tax=Acytostelium subglobosum LB1 TaxID=1410327 RepID=UPI000644E927|nr:hypothetical protein SAMD00019534_080450 [Acytostelium subglobosum LB1]GAM24870.1 hypothetical protein SAMD00019534_080450 [Acytostelium subglobosum LB1]|eukprot:XP_012751959.1 hypothetical protein SAMD00019534_080450 [Acytostelium subglobosum LB1]
MSTVYAYTATSVTNMMSLDLRSDNWTKHELLRANRIGRIVFVESDVKNTLDSTFWNNNMDFIAEMFARSVELMFHMGRQLTFSLSHVPLTVMVIQPGPDDRLPNANMFPRTLTELSIGGEFNTMLCDLPDSLTTLRIQSRAWDQPIAPGALPPRLKRLYCGRTFNQLIADKTFPRTLEYVQFGYSFDKPLNSNNLPESVTDISFFRYSHPFSHRTCVRLDMGGTSKFAHGLVFPSLTHLRTKVDPAVLIASSFPSLRTLDYSGWCHYLVDYSTLPHTLTELTTHETRPIVSFTQGLHTLDIRCESGFRMTNTTLPQSLRTLTLRSYHHPIEAALFPPSLTSLNAIKWTHPLHPNQLPPSIQMVSIIHNHENGDQHLEQMLASTSLFHIKINIRSIGRVFAIELCRISDTLFLKYDRSILSQVTECSFIGIDSIMAMYHKSKVAPT